MNAIATKTTVIELTLTLSFEEAARLRGMMQNAFSEDELPIDGRIREWIFTSLEQAMFKED